MHVSNQTTRPGLFWQKTMMVLLACLALLCGQVRAAETVTYIYTDLQGTVLAKADAAGNLVASSDYRPYGSQVMGTPEPGPGYTGHVTDPDSGLVYMQARYYDPAIGRFLSVDPSGGDPGDLFVSGRYSYASNNPVLNVDPDGRQAFAGWSDSQVHMVAQDPEAGDAFAHIFVTSLPVVGDVSNVVEAFRDPSPVNLIAAGIGVFPEGGGAAANVLRLGTSGGKRAGKIFTRAGKAEVKELNAAAHEGRNVCEACGRETVPAKQSKKGVTPPGNETQVDHIIAKARNGDGSPSNGQVLCRDCNLDKGAD